jgi:hypothetical protein
LLTLRVETVTVFKVVEPFLVVVEGKSVDW